MAEDVLKKIYNACDPYLPASADYYYDCSEARGETALTQLIQRHLGLADDHTCFLLSGHIGCGKSSELAKLARALTIARQPDNCYFPVLVDVSEYLDDYDVTLTDILLAIVTELANALRVHLNIELRDNYFTKRLNEVKEFFLSDVEIKEGELSLGYAKAKVQRLQKNPTARQKVREKLEPKLSSMLEEINLVFDEARLEIRKHCLVNAPQPCSDLVIILDNLEKIRKLGDEEDELQSHRELFLERHKQLSGMRAHFIYTVPLRLVRSSDGPQLEQRYGMVFVLPMIKVIERATRAPYPRGVESIRAILQKRLGEVKLEDAFTPEALDFLLTYSGGHVRNLMIFVQNACTYTDTIPIPLRAVQEAVKRSIRSYSTAIPEAHWDKLAQLELSSDQHIPNGDNDYLKMLENLSIMEYSNGGDEEQLTDAEPWYAVNPVVRELKKFKEAVDELRLPVEAIRLSQDEHQ